MSHLAAGAGARVGLSGGGALVGLVLAVGVLLIWHRLPAHRATGLEDRMAPYLRDVVRPSGLLTNRLPVSPTDWRERFRTGALRCGRGFDHLVGGPVSLRRRLIRAGVVTSVEDFRAEQVLWAAAGTMAGALTSTALWLGGNGSLTLPVLAPVTGALAGVIARDYLLTRVVTRREKRIQSEFPTVAELLALSVSAGEGATQALERVCRLCRGELSGELGLALADARAGTALVVALQGVADRSELTSLVRFVDGMIIALERGTPLADVLRAQAQDVQDEGRRTVMEAAGRKEIGMLVPVVFLILPVTVLFALYPGIDFLSFTY